MPQEKHPGAVSGLSQKMHAAKVLAAVAQVRSEVVQIAG
jgi:hypothetical protein